MTLIDALQKRHSGALVTVQGMCSYRSLAEQGARIQHELDAHLPISEPFALVMGATVGCVAALLAALQSSRAVVLLPATLSPTESGMVLAESRVSLLVQPTGGQTALTVPERWHAAAAVDTLSFARGPGLPAGDGPLMGMGTGALLCQLTSGSTGTSRLAVRALAGVETEVAAVVHHLALSADDTILVTSSLTHSYALCGGVFGALRSGARLVAAANSDETVALARATQPTVIFGLAASYLALMAADDRTALARTRLALSAGAPLPDGLFERFLAWCGLPIRQDYGTTEVGTITLDLGEPATPATVGRPLRHVTARLAPPLQARLRADEEGEIVVRSEAAARWYLERGQAIPCVDRDGWYRTGDAGSWDGDGRLLLGRRLRPPVITAAGTVDLDAVEQVVLTLPGVEEAVAVAAEDGQGNVRVRLVVVAPTVPVETLRRWCTARLAPQEVPTLIAKRDALPRSPAGKILSKYLVC
jgi:acyl-coenzyme A synthetase/AMP-(fatty) acid ligase